MGVIALPNPASVRLHERHGFVQVGLLADAGYKLKRWHDVAFWQRRLNGGEQAPPTLKPVGAQSTQRHSSFDPSG
jgi:phosphinothricin acetyltransferase